MTVGADEPSAAAGGAASNRQTNKQTNEQCRNYRSQSTLTGLLLWVVFSLLIPPAIPDVLMWKDNPACGPHKFVEVPDSELAFYWPGKCDRCHLTASTSTEAMACCKGENAAWDCISKSQSRSHNTSENVECGSWTGSPKGIGAINIRVENHQCSRYPNVNGTDGGKHYPMRLRKHLRYRLDGLAPNRGSALDRFVDLVGSRKVHFLGDSVLKQFVEYLEVRAFDLDAAKLSRHPSLYLSIRNLVQFNDCYNHQAKCNIPVRGTAGDIVISSFGNHFDPTAGLTFNKNRKDAYLPSLLSHLHRLNVVGNSSARNVAIHLGVWAQHFQSHTGAYPSDFPRTAKQNYADWFHSMREAAWFDEVADPRAPYQTGAYRCMPPTARAYSCGASSDTRSPYARIFEEIPARHFPNVTLLSFNELTQELYDVHFGGADCTHWCYMPGLIEGAVGLVNEAISSSYKPTD